MFARGTTGSYRVPVGDSMTVLDGASNLPDLAYEITALIRPDRDLPQEWDHYWVNWDIWPSSFEMTYGVDDITSPLGSVTNSVATLNIGGLAYGWERKGHSDHVDLDLDEIWDWYDLILTDVPNANYSVLPRGKE